MLHFTDVSPCGKHVSCTLTDVNLIRDKYPYEKRM